jgi:hypothetical protein
MKNITIFKGIVGNEKVGGGGVVGKMENDVNLFRNVVINVLFCLLIWPPSWINYISFYLISVMTTALLTTT